MKQKEFIKTLLYILTALASVATWIYSNNLTNKLAIQERKNIELWRDAIEEVESTDLDGEVSQIAYKIIKENTTIPAILFLTEGRVQYANIDPDTAKYKSVEDYLQKKSKAMHEIRQPMIFERDRTHNDILYYDDSSILKQIEIYPIIQLVVTIMIILITFFGIRASNKADQNRMMVGMSKETAHQLGTPISSLLAWVEILKADENYAELTQEVEKDVNRLVKITDRFSRIGNKPELETQDICPVLKNSIIYLQSRTSQNIVYTMDIPDKEIKVPINISLFEWVIENLSKNAIDAMQGKGKLNIKLYDDSNNAYIEVTDSGKGISKRYFKTIFKPGYTTKKHGWGLGLSLAQRIVNDYHKGKIYVKDSEQGKGTTFRIIFPK